MGQKSFQRDSFSKKFSQSHFLGFSPLLCPWIPFSFIYIGNFSASAEGIEALRPISVAAKMLGNSNYMSQSRGREIVVTRVVCDY